MAGLWKRDGSVSVTNGSKKVIGTGTTFADTKNWVAAGHLFCLTTGTTLDLYEVERVASNTELYLVQAYRGVSMAGKDYEIITTFTDSLPDFARKLNAALAYYQSQSDMVQQLFTSDDPEITVVAPDGTSHKLIPWKQVTNVLDTRVPVTRTVNGYPLTKNIVITAQDLGIDTDGGEANGNIASAILAHEASEGTHSISGVAGLKTALSGKANVSHSHVISNVIGLQAALDSKYSAANPPPKVVGTNFSVFIPRNPDNPLSRMAVRLVDGAYYDLPEGTEYPTFMLTCTQRESYPSEASGAGEYINFVAYIKPYVGPSYASADVNVMMLSGDIANVALWSDTNRGFWLDVNAPNQGYVDSWGLDVTITQLDNFTDERWPLDRITYDLEPGGGWSEVALTDITSGGTIEDIEGLQAALDGKAAASHSHTLANVTGLQAALDDKYSPDNPPPASGGSAVTNPLEGLNLTGDATGAVDGCGRFGSLGGSLKWRGGVLAPNGMIYGIPCNAPDILEIDPMTQKTVRTPVESFSYYDWSGGVLAPNGKIYCIPFNATQVLEFNPASGEKSRFGSLDGQYKWSGGVLAPNGYIYAVPYSSSELLCIDPAGRAAYPFGSVPGNEKWEGGVLAPNGKIYCIPFNATQVLEIDPTTDTTYLFGSLPGGYQWAGGVLAPNGKIYGIPCNATQVLEIDPATRTVTLFGSLPGNSAWMGGVLAPNGKIYGIPNNAGSVLEIDPATKTATQIGHAQMDLLGSAACMGGVLAPNGNIYGIPANATEIPVISKGAHGPHYWATSAYVNKY